MPRTDLRTTFADRLLAEVVRLREEAAGHPAESALADALATQAGGNLLARIHARARALPGAERIAATIRRALQSGYLLAALLLVVAVAAGCTAAIGALGAAQPASLPLVLLVVVGSNVATLLFWLLASPWSRRIAPGLGSLMRSLWSHFAQRPSEPQDSTREVLQLIGAGGVGRWLLATLVHAAWLTFALAALLTLVVLLSVRSYALSWETTLLSTDALANWAQALSLGPALLGAAGMDLLSVTDTASATARQAWSYWLLCAVFFYGVLPRAIALLACLFLLSRALAPVGRDLSRPGYARLRQRLLPDHNALGVVDRAPPLPVATAPRSAAAPATLPLGVVHGLWIDGLAADSPPPIAGITWVWLGNVDDIDSRREALQRLRGENIAALAILVRATLTPDRGMERSIAELKNSVNAPTYLVLVELATLRARGAEICVNRLNDWRALAVRAGIHTGLVTLPDAARTSTGVTL